MFALVFGPAALFCALTAILSPAALVLGVIRLILAFVGLKMAKKPGVTGKASRSAAWSLPCSGWFSAEWSLAGSPPW